MGLKKNFFYNATLTCANYIFPLIVYPYVSRVLGVSNIGLVNFIDSIINYFVLFSVMGISITGIRQIASVKEDRVKLDSTFSSILTLNAISTFIMLILLIVATIFVPQLRENYQLMAVGALKLISNIFLIEWFYKGMEDFKYITLRSIVVRSFYVISVFIFVREKEDILNYYLLTCLVTFFNAIVNAIHSRKFVSFGIKNLNIKPLLSSFFILGLYMILTSMYTTFNVTYLGFVTNTTQVGFYTTASKLYTIFVGLFTAFTNVMLPRMSALATNGNTEEFLKKYKQSIDLLISFAIPVIVGVFIFAPEIIMLISGPGYEGAIAPMRIIIPLVLIIGYEQILVIQTLMPLKKDKIIFRNSIIGAAVSVACNLIIVTKLGAVGSSITWVSCEIIILILSQTALSKILPIPFDFKGLIKVILSYIPLMAILTIIQQLHLNYLISLSIGIAVSLLYMIMIIRYFTPSSNPLRVYLGKVLQKLY